MCGSTASCARSSCRASPVGGPRVYRKRDTAPLCRSWRPGTRGWPPGIAAVPRVVNTGKEVDGHRMEGRENALHSATRGPWRRDRRLQRIQSWEENTTAGQGCPIPGGPAPRLLHLRSASHAKALTCPTDSSPMRLETGRGFYPGFPTLGAKSPRVQGLSSDSDAPWGCVLRAPHLERGHTELDDLQLLFHLQRPMTFSWEPRGTDLLASLCDSTVPF